MARSPERMPLTIDWIVRAVGGTLLAGRGAAAAAGVSIDSRTIRRGQLYIAIRGERFDGADFAADAVARGAMGALMPRGRGAALIGRATDGSPAAIVEVDDTTTGLQALARQVRLESGARVVAITGSAGKTTTKEVIAQFLETKYRVIRNRGNLNNHIGLPLSLLELTERPDVAVVELGMNHAGEIRTLVGIAEPDVRVWTNVGEAHLGFFDSVDAIADAKAEILEGGGPRSVLVANADDDRIVTRTKTFAGRMVTFGIERAADVRAEVVSDRGLDGFTARVATSRGAADIATALVGRANLANVLAATAVALEFDVPLPAIVERAAALRPAPHRGEIVRLADGATVIDDSYNANPTATRRALDLLVSARADRRMAVLGEMLELGAESERLHREVGRAAAAARIDRLFTVGGNAARAMAEAAVADGMPAESVRYFAASDEAGAAIVPLVRRGDVVLVKGSRGIRTDAVVERLKAERA